MNKTMINSFSKTLLAIGIASAASITHASSFALIENSASGQGAAFAGAAAVAEDASTIYFNPAGMTQLSGSQVVVAGHIVAVTADYTDSGDSTTFAGSPLLGSNSSADETGFIPNFYYSTELENGVFVGVGVNVPFGLATDYDNGWVGRYHSLLSEIASVNINPSIAWKATDSVSVGFGLSIQYVELELTNNIDSFAACAGLEAAAGGPTGPVTCDYAIPGDAARDSKLKLDGDSLEFGWNTGILIEMENNSRLGIAYRSSVKHDVEGDAAYNLDGTLDSVATQATAAFGFNVLQNTPLEATAELPETFSVSFAGDINEKWTALFDWTWTGWSNLDTIVIRQEGGIPGQEPTLDLDYANTNRYSVGVHYRPDNKWVYRGGLAFDETPIKTPESTTARIPGNDRTWLSFGLGYAPSTTWSLDFGYSHLFISDTDINSNTGASSSGATLIGSYESSVDILSAQANFNF
ncbi:MAG: outer membrane protein transport protein [Gammaproteobacteria bacterium]|nr:outer membrane protein transport protein [Gammaproteobacteria bacterium]